MKSNTGHVERKRQSAVARTTGTSSRPAREAKALDAESHEFAASTSKADVTKSAEFGAHANACVSDSSELVSTTISPGSQQLSREAILSKALELADESGIENLSARRLAAALGKTPMALYRYFDSMAEIQQGVLALAFSEVDTRAIPGERWDDTLRRTTASIREVYHRHANAHLHSIPARALDPGLFAHTERIQRLHGDQGIPEDILPRLWRIIDAYLSGFIFNESCEMQASDAQTESVDRSSLPAWADTTELAYTDQSFSDGIEIIIAGIRELAAPDPCEWRTPEGA